MKARRWPVFWLAAWLLAFALWMVHVDSPKLPEIVAGVIVATVAATGTELARGQRVAGIAVRPSFLAHAWRVVLRALPDIGRLIAAAFSQSVRPRAARGRVVALRFPHGGEEPEENGRRALAQALGSLAPNTIVVGVDPERGRLIAHQLVPTGDPDELDSLGLR